MVNMWTAEKIYYRNSDNFTRAYQGNELVWEKPSIIYYTSTDGQSIWINYGYDYGANVVSNTYSGGVGKIVFDGPPTKIPASFMLNSTTLSTITLLDSITEIGGDAFKGCTSLSSVTLSQSLNTIKSYAFQNCSSLTSITLPNSLTELGGGVFKNSGLTSVNIPASLTNMNWSPQPFDGCNNLTRITVDPNNANYTDYNSNAIYTKSSYRLYSGCRNTVIYPGTQMIMAYAFRGITSLTSIIIPDTVEQISDWAFASTGISSINIPYSVNHLGTRSFDSCTNLTSVTIPQYVNYIGGSAFAGCSSLLTVIFKKSTPPTTAGSGIFNNNAQGRLIYVPSSGLQAYKTTFSAYENDIVGYGLDTIFYKTTSNIAVNPTSGASFGANLVSNSYATGIGVMTFDGTVTSIGNNAFKDIIISEIDIPEGVTSIGVSAFQGCIYLKNINIPSAVTSIDVTSYNGCENIESITVDPNNTYFDSRNGCNAIIRVTTNNLRFGCKNTVIPSSVVTLGGNAFYGRKMKANGINIPSSVTTISTNTFQNVTGMEKITIPSSVTSIGNNAFYKASDLNRIYVNRTTPPSLGTSVFYSEAPGRVIVVPASSLNTYKTATRWQNYNPYIIADTPGVIYYITTNSQAITSFHYLTDFGANIVSNVYDTQQDMGTITFDGPVTKIKWAFYNQDTLESIILPSTIGYIGYSTFEDCNSLISANIPPIVQEIGFCAFYGCRSLSSVTIPDTVKNIDQGAFRSCTNLISVTVNATTPPTIESDIFINNAPGRKIYVPAGSLTAYQTATGWSDYASDIEAQ